MRLRKAMAPITAAYNARNAPMPDEQRRFVVGTELVDREVLHGDRNVVDHTIADVEDRALPTAAQTSHEFRGPSATMAEVRPASAPSAVADRFEIVSAAMPVVRIRGRIGSSIGERAR